MIFITAHLFLFQNTNILKRLFTDHFFEIVQEMIKAKFMLENKKFSPAFSFEVFQK